MAIPVLVILAALWGAFFLWPVVSGRSERRRVDSIDDFSHRLGVIGKAGGHRRRQARTSPIPLGVPATRALASTNGIPVRPVRADTARRRRRDVLLVLGALAIVGLGAAMLVGSTVAWLGALVTWGLLLAYVVALVQIQQRTTERRTKVRYLPSAPTPPTQRVEPPAGAALRRTAAQPS